MPALLMVAATGIVSWIVGDKLASMLAVRDASGNPTLFGVALYGGMSIGGYILLKKAGAFR
jgi:hypothetical protein